ncbi:hypothetical protein F5Y15DRAFT_332672 [Xylariaceae sp. FL0016]|nr:hypothetical protein F5Y15DRAFT_332672 [Xylariaceae sp. FL0016]
MAKERATSLEKASKAEKKLSKDRVHKKDKKEKTPKHSKREATPGSPENESTSDADDQPVEDVAIPDTVPLDEVEKKHKKERKSKKDKKVKKSKEDAIEEAVAETKDDEEPQLFAIDVKPTKVDLDSIQIQGPEDENENSEDQATFKSQPPSGMNRAARRRIQLIERQREKIQKKLGVEPGPEDQNEEVRTELAKWIEDQDGKTAMRMERKRIRKEKGAAKVKNKRGKILTGSKLKERTRQLTKMEKKAVKKTGLFDSRS